MNYGDCAFIAFTSQHDLSVVLTVDIWKSISTPEAQAQWNSQARKNDGKGRERPKHEWMWWTYRQQLSFKPNEKEENYLPGHAPPNTTPVDQTNANGRPGRNKWRQRVVYVNPDREQYNWTWLGCARHAQVHCHGYATSEAAGTSDDDHYGGVCGTRRIRCLWRINLIRARVHASTTGWGT